MAASVECRAEPSDDEPVDLELILAVDVSGSVDYEEGELQRQGYISAFRHPRVVQTIRSGYHGRIAVTYVEWADTYKRSVIAPWTVVSDDASAARLTGRLSEGPRTKGLYTSISSAIEFVRPMFDGNGFAGRRKVIDISGDGPNNTGALVTGPRDVAVAAGITINGLPIVNNRPDPRGRLPMPDLDLYYRDCVIGGPWSFLIVAEGFESFADAVRRKLLIEIGGGPPDGEGIQRADDGAGEADLLAAAAGALRLPLMRPDRQPRALVSERTVRATGDERVAPPCDAGEQRLRRRQMFLDRP